MHRPYGWYSSHIQLGNSALILRHRHIGIQHLRVALASHRPLSDSRRERSSLPSQPWESTVLDSTHPSAAPSKPGLRRDPPEEQARPASAHTWPGRTSGEGVPICGTDHHRGGSEYNRQHSSRRPHQDGRCTQPRGATDTELRALRSCGRSSVALYNTVCPHSSLGCRPPSPEVLVPASKLAPRPTLN
jgi:hypothetical protein